MFLDQLAADVYIKFKDGRWGAVKVLSPLRQVADSSPLISICYRQTVAFRSGARFSFASVTPFQRFWVKERKKKLKMDVK